MNPAVQNLLKELRAMLPHLPEYESGMAEELQYYVRRAIDAEIAADNARAEADSARREIVRLRQQLREAK